MSVEFPEPLKVDVVHENEVTYRADQDFGDHIAYSGQLKFVNGIEVQHGRGKQNWPDGSKYEGEWRDGVAHGIGHIHHPNGDQYEGEFVNG